MALFRDLSAHGLQLNQTTPQRWADRQSIPAEYWADLIALGVASLDELMAAAKPRRKTPDPAPRRQSKAVA